MNYITKLNLQTLGCLIAFAFVVVLFERTIRSYWQIWLAVAVVTIFVFMIWAVLSKRRMRKLKAEYGFAIVHRGWRSGEIQAFHGEVVAFSIPVDFDGDPPHVNFTAAMIDIPKADVEMWRERLSEYLKRVWKRYVIV